MDSSQEYPSEPAPISKADKIQAISALIGGQDDTEQSQGDSAPAGDTIPADDVRGDDSGPGAVDSPEPDANESVQDDPKGAEAGSDAQGEESPITLSKLAEHLEVEAADVYELEIPIADGVVATLGQLKDEYKEYGPAKEYGEKLQEDRGNFEKQVLATRSELNAIVNAIPPEIREHVINAGREHQAQWAKDQEQTVLEAIPEWQDADQRATDRAHLVEDGAEYGFSEAEITYTQDARTLRMLRDFSKMRRELQGMRAAAKREPGKASRPGKPTPTSSNKRKLAQAINRAKSDPTIQGKAAAVTQLIRNQT